MSILRSFMLGKMQMHQCFVLPLIYMVVSIVPSGWRSKYSIITLLCQCRWTSVCFVLLLQHLVSVQAGSQASCGFYFKLRMHSYKLSVSLCLARRVHSSPPTTLPTVSVTTFIQFQHLRGLQMKCL